MYNIAKTKTTKSYNEVCYMCMGGDIIINGSISEGNNNQSMEHLDNCFKWTDYLIISVDC